MRRKECRLRIPQALVDLGKRKVAIAAHVEPPEQLSPPRNAHGVPSSWKAAEEFRIKSARRRESRS